MQALGRVVLLALLVAAALPARAADRIGVVLLHGKNGTPRQLAVLDHALAAAGYAVAAPEMCYARTRIYDRDLGGCLAAVDASITRLRGEGATRLVVGGASLGALVAFAYAAGHPGLAGIIGLAPAGNPPGLGKVPEIARSIAAAQAARAAGQDGPARYADQVVGEIIHVRAAPAAYLDFLGPDSPIVMARTLPRLRAPLLWVAGTRDATQSIGRKAFARVPANGLSAYATVDADHQGTPDASGEVVVAWLRRLAGG